MEWDQFFIHVKVCAGITVRHGVISVEVMPHIYRHLLAPLLYHGGDMMAHLLLRKRVFMGMGQLALFLRSRWLRLGMLVPETPGEAVTSLLFYVSYNDVQHHSALLAVTSVRMFCGSPVCICGAPRGGKGKLDSHPLYILCWDIAYLFSPFRGELFKIFGQLVGRVVGPFVNELLVVKPLLHDDVAHGKCHGSVCSRENGVPLVRLSSRIAHAGVKVYELGMVSDPSFHHPLDIGVMEVRCLIDIRAKYKHVLCIGKVRGLYVRPPGWLHTYLLARFAYRGVVKSCV